MQCAEARLHEIVSIALPFAPKKELLDKAGRDISDVSRAILTVIKARPREKAAFEAENNQDEQTCLQTRYQYLRKEKALKAACVPLVYHFLPCPGMA